MSRGASEDQEIPVFAALAAYVHRHGRRIDVRLAHESRVVEPCAHLVFRQVWHETRPAIVYRCQRDDVRPAVGDVSPVVGEPSVIAYQCVHADHPAEPVPCGLPDRGEVGAVREHVPDELPVGPGLRSSAFAGHADRKLPEMHQSP